MAGLRDLATTGPQRASHLHAWLVAVLFFGVGDVVTTGVGVELFAVAEQNPVPAMVLQRYGVPGVVGLKLLVIACFGLLWRAFPRPYCAGIPLGLAVIGLAVTAWNLLVLFAVVL